MSGQQQNNIEIFWGVEGKKWASSSVEPQNTEYSAQYRVYLLGYRNSLTLYVINKMNIVNYACKCHDIEELS
jgi:hypothetical protein